MGFSEYKNFTSKMKNSVMSHNRFLLFKSYVPTMLKCTVPTAISWQTPKVFRYLSFTSRFPLPFLFSPNTWQFKLNSSFHNSSSCKVALKDSWNALQSLKPSPILVFNHRNAFHFIFYNSLRWLIVRLILLKKY